MKPGVKKTIATMMPSKYRYPVAQWFEIEDDHDLKNESLLSNEPCHHLLQFSSLDICCIGTLWINSVEMIKWINDFSFLCLVVVVGRMCEYPIAFLLNIRTNTHNTQNDPIIICNMNFVHLQTLSLPLLSID